MIRILRRTAAALLLLTSCLHADGLRDNDPSNVRQVPPPGIAVPDEIRSVLEEGLNRLQEAIQKLKDNEAVDASLVPDVEIFHRAVKTVLEHNEFFSKNEFDHARQLLSEGIIRAKSLADGEAPWTTQTGLVVRGFRSKLDQTVQPYGLVIPSNAKAGSAIATGPKRLDVWLHGRGERTSEVGFIHQRMHQVGRFAPKNTIVLHPYGRYSNAFKFAGEVDVLEAIDAVKKHYAIDEDRISVRGFSMGGAGCWQFAVHYADRWFAANPGAGFSETPEFLRFFQKETLKPTWYEEKLWRWYDCNGYATNLLHCPTIAYSGELDIQKQAADVMESALKEIGVDLVHIIGAKTKHTIDEVSKQEIERRMDELAVAGRHQMPAKIDFQTFTLKYNRMHWVQVDALTEHWEPATVEASLSGSRLMCKTSNIDGISFQFPAGTFQEIRKPIAIQIGSQTFQAKPLSDRSLSVSFARQNERWQEGTLEEAGTGGAESLRKKPGLQGPIDDAFMDSFLFVEPEEQPTPSSVDRWAKSEFEHAVRHWRQQFRGDARTKRATDITADDVKNSHLVLFGTPNSNSYLAKVLDRLPLMWDTSRVQIGKDKFNTTDHAPILIYPNPENPDRYVVVNSGFTYREYAYLNNARQVPMLPDWAIVDVRTPATSQFPGKVVAADFFDERWQPKP